MKKLLSTLEVAELIMSSFNSAQGLVRNGFTDKNMEKVIGVELGSPNRSSGLLNLGGLDATEYAMLPINFVIRWTNNFSICNNIANELYMLLLDISNVTYKRRVFSMVQMLDGTPISLGKDKDICEMMIRANIIYKLEMEE